MYALITFLSFIALLLVLVGIHELGHFATARFFGIAVEEFGFGFPPRVWARRGRSGTLYSINAIPLGGFVRMKGENGEAVDRDSFGAKPAWQRAIVLCAGAAMNLFGALLLFFLVYTIAPIPLDTPRISHIQAGSPAARVLRIGDLVTAVGSTHVDSQRQVGNLTTCNAGRPIVLTIERAGQTITRTVVPRLHPAPGQGRVGFTGSVEWSGTDPLHALGQALQEPGRFVGSVAAAFRPPPCTPKADVSGPVGIARQTGDVANNVGSLGLGPLFYLAALLSMNLAIVNLLPFPALDGGRLAFVLFGAVRRRRVDPQREGLIHFAGFAVLLIFVLVVSSHDISAWISGK